MKGKPVKRTIAVMVAVAILGLALPVVATQNEEITEGWYTVAWEVPGPGQFPQHLVDYAAVKDLDFFDNKLDECKNYQVDIYKIDSNKDIDTLVGLIERGILDLNDNGLPEDNKIWHTSKRVEALPECTPEETTTTTTTLQESTTTTAINATSTSTTEASTSSTSSSTTSSTTPPTSSVPPTEPPTQPPTELPFTGSNDGLKLVVASILGIAGLASVGLARRLHGQG